MIKNILILVIAIFVLLCLCVLFIASTFFILFSVAMGNVIGSFTIIIFDLLLILNLYKFYEEDL